MLALRALVRSVQRNASVQVSRTSHRRILLRNMYAPMMLQQHHRLFSSTSSSSRHGASVASAGDALPETSPSEPRMAIAFTCAVAGCGERSAHHFTKRSYERGIVLVQCPKCKNRSVVLHRLVRLLR